MIRVFHVFDAGAATGQGSKMPDLGHGRTIQAECGRPAACALLSLCLVQHRCLDGFYLGILYEEALLQALASSPPTTSPASPLLSGRVITYSKI